MTDIGKLILRLGVAILLAFHGISKITKGIAWMFGPLHAHHLQAFLAYGVYVAEVVAPILLIVGIFTRPAALLIAFELSMALFLVVGPKTFAITPQTGALGGEEPEDPLELGTGRSILDHVPHHVEARFSSGRATRHLTIRLTQKRDHRLRVSLENAVEVGAQRVFIAGEGGAEQREARLRRALRPERVVDTGGIVSVGSWRRCRPCPPCS